MQTADTPISTVREIWSHFHDPAHMVEIQAPQRPHPVCLAEHVRFRVHDAGAADGPISELPEHPEASIGDIAFTRSTST